MLEEIRQRGGGCRRSVVFGGFSCGAAAEAVGPGERSVDVQKTGEFEGPVVWL